MRVIIFIAIIFLFGCKTKTKNIEINLTLGTEPNVAFNERYNTRKVYSLIEKLPKYYKKQLESFNFKKEDSIIISTLNTDYNQFYFEMYREGYLSKVQFLEKKIDSAIEIKKSPQKQLLIAIKFNKKEQIIIVDENNNGFFSDDKPIYFDRNFRIQADDSLIINNIPLINFNYWNYKDSQINKFNRKVIVYPSLNDNGFSESNNDIIKKSRLIIKLADYWLGNLEIEKESYDIVVQGFYNTDLTILIKPSSLKFDNENYVFNENFEYQIKDSISLGNKIYVIDSITNDVSSLILKPTDKKAIYGFRKGQKIKNFRLNNLNGEQVDLYSFSKNKKYTLLDFWGTWCKPCVKTIPELKAIYSKNLKNINLISIARDNNIGKVKDFVHANDMKWNNFFVERTRMSTGIIKDLNITVYPTLILINSNQKIIYRGSGTDAIEKINDILFKG